MSSSSGLAAAKRRRGTTGQGQPGQGQPGQGQPGQGQQYGQQQQQEQQQQQPPVNLTVSQSIYMLSNRINSLEGKLQDNIDNNINTNDSNQNDEVSSSLNTDEFISKTEFNTVMTSIGSDMNDISQKMNTLNEFVTSVQNSYLVLNTAIFNIQQRISVGNIMSNDNNLDSLSMNEVNSDSDDSYDNDNNDNNDNNSENTTSAVSADITSRLKMLNKHLSSPILQEEEVEDVVTNEGVVELNNN